MICWCKHYSSPTDPNISLATSCLNSSRAKETLSFMAALNWCWNPKASLSTTCCTKFVLSILITLLVDYLFRITVRSIALQLQHLLHLSDLLPEAVAVDLHPVVVHLDRHQAEVVEALDLPSQSASTFP